MTEAHSGPSTGNAIALVVIVAIVTAVVATLVQVLIRGHSNTPVTGGVVGAITAIVAITATRKKPG